VLDPLLVDAAAAAGADVRTGLNVTGVTRHLGRVTGIAGRDEGGDDVTINARFVVGADGLRSRIARAVGAAIVDQRPPGGATHYTYFRAPSWNGFEFHIGPGIMAGVFPTNEGEANVWACTPAATTPNLAGDRGDHFVELLAQANPVLAERMAVAARTAPIRSAFALPNHKRDPWGPGWALVGDAGMHRDPVSGHGITDAFRDAELLARALDAALRHETSEAAAGQTYRARRDELSAEVFDATALMSQYPPVEEFVAQQRRVNAAVDVEADFLAALSPWPAPLAAVA
jgi:flavin-dependent dehydrogenase